MMSTIGIGEQTQSAVNFAELGTKGFTTLSLLSSSADEFPAELLGLAAQLGDPVPARVGGDVCVHLSPISADKAKRHSLSGIHALGGFPLHSDTAHWVTPCRFIILGCESPGSGNRPTMLMDIKRLSFSREQISILRSTPLRVINGRNSFFSSILAKARPFVRFDTGCMEVTKRSDSSALEILSPENWPDELVVHNWDEKQVLVIDNWRVLHGRGTSEVPDGDRKLIRILIQ